MSRDIIQTLIKNILYKIISVMVGLQYLKDKKTIPGQSINIYVEKEEQYLIITNWKNVIFYF